MASDKHIVTPIDVDERSGTCSVCGPTKIVRRARPHGIKWTCSFRSSQWRTKGWGEYERRDQLKDPGGRITVPAGTRERLLEEQNGLCRICSEIITDDNKALDHCHAKRIIRGYLCRNCNWALGLFNDDPERMRAAADYIEYYRKGDI